LISLFGGAKVNVVRLEETPEMVLITPAWGFIIVCAVEESGGHVLLIYDGNGRIIRKVALPGAVRQWCGWKSRDGFDFLLIVTRDGRVFIAEAFWGVLWEPVLRASAAIVACAYCHAAGVVVLLSEDGQVVLLPAIRQ
jgi:hypothetical protein